MSSSTAGDRQADTFGVEFLRGLLIIATPMIFFVTHLSVSREPIDIVNVILNSSCELGNIHFVCLTIIIVNIV